MLPNVYFWRTHNNIDTYLEQTFGYQTETQSRFAQIQMEMMDFHTWKSRVESDLKHSRTQGLKKIIVLAFCLYYR